MRCGAMRLALQCLHTRARSLGRGLGARRRAVTALIIPFSALARFARCLSLARRRQLDTGSPRFGQADRDRLLGRSPAVLAFADVMHLLADKLARLRGGGLAFAFIAPRSLDRFLFGHR